MDESKKATVGSLVDKNNIIAAGKSIKGAVYAALFMIIGAVIVAIIIATSEDMSVVKSAYQGLAFLAVICNLFILERLYSCGDNLENSVIKNKSVQIFNH